jgi:hypothetical protein
MVELIQNATPTFVQEMRTARTGLKILIVTRAITFLRTTARIGEIRI